MARLQPDEPTPGARIDRALFHTDAYPAAFAGILLLARGRMSARVFHELSQTMSIPTAIATSHAAPKFTAKALRSGRVMSRTFRGSQVRDLRVSASAARSRHGR